MVARARIRKAAPPRVTQTNRWSWELAAQVHFLLQGECMLPDQQIDANSRLGFIGLGHLGSPIARRLAAKFPMTVYDRDRAKAEGFRAMGAAVADDPRSLAVEADV